MAGGSWKVAYADFVTAMMSFFLLMWILNMVPPETKKGLAAYFSGEGTFESSSVSPVSNNPFIQSTDKIDARLNFSEIQQSHYAIAQKLREMLMADAIPQSATGISADDVGVLLRVNSATSFLPGSSDLTAEGKRIMEEVKGVLLKYNLYLVVRGHAETGELTAGSPFRSNWELSGARAASAVRYLVESGIKATRLRAVAYADTRPLEPSNGLDGGSRNRRVEFYFHRPEVMSYGVVY